MGKLEKVPLCNVWKNETRDFTAWLESNVDVLSDAIGSPITVVERKKDVGAFALANLASDSAGRTVIIESQSERTNHDHLGKLLTYLTNLDVEQKQHYSRSEFNIMRRISEQYPTWSIDVTRRRQADLAEWADRVRSEVSFLGAGARHVGVAHDATHTGDEG